MSEEYSLNVDKSNNTATLSGVMRLASPIAYKPVLQPIQDAIDASPPQLRIDLSGLVFLNSSGVTALSRLIMSARQNNVGLVCVVDDAVPWQRKTLSSFQRLYPRLELVAR